MKPSAWLAAALLAATPALGGCAGSYNAAASFQPPSGVLAKAHPELAGRAIRRIAVLPFRNESGSPLAGLKLADFYYEGLAASGRYEVQPPPRLDQDDEIRFELRLRSIRPEGVRNQEQDADWLRQRVSRFLSAVQPYLASQALVYPGEYFEGEVQAKPEAPRGTVARAEAGQAAQAPFDAVLTGIVTTYRNRSGNALLGEQGAHVVYTVYLVGAQDGKVLWEASFNEEQIYLFDNLLLFARYAREGFVWQTSDTLARNGMERVLRAFPGYAGQPPAQAAAQPKP